MIKEIGIGVVGARWRKSEIGVLRMLVPLPLPLDSDPCMRNAGIDDFARCDDAWNSDFEALVREVVQSIDDGGAVEVRAPVRGARSGSDRLARFLTFRRERNPLDPNPDRLTPDAALCSAARDAAYLVNASVETRQASVSTSDARPMLWIWTGADDTTWRELEARIARRKPTKLLSLDFSCFGAGYSYVERPTLVDAARNTVYWTDWVHVLALAGQFLLPHPGNLGCEDPRIVFLPPESEWVRVAPSWAATLYPRLLDDLASMGLKLVHREGAQVRAGST